MYPSSLLVPPPLFLPLSPVDSPVSTGSHSLVLTLLPLSSFPPTFHRLLLSPTQFYWLLSGPLHMCLYNVFMLKSLMGPSPLQMLTRDREALHCLSFACFYYSFICLLIYSTVCLPTE